MRLEVASPPKPSLFLSKPADSFYNDLSECSVLNRKSIIDHLMIIEYNSGPFTGINSPSKFESITDMIRSKMEESDGRFLIGPEEKERPDWSALFDGSHPVVVQKNISSSCSSPHPDASTKKRRAPPPPTDRQPSSPLTRPPRPPLPASLPPSPPLSHLEKENSSSCPSRSATRSKTGRPSLDAKFSAIIQQLQRNGAGGPGALSRRNAPLGVLDVQPQSQPLPPRPQQDEQLQHAAGEAGFVGPHRGPGLRKSFRGRMNFKAL